MDFAETAPIGASVIDYMERNAVHHQEHSAVDDDCDALFSESIIPYSDKACNILLRGPSVASERGSLVMNMAHSIASRHREQEERIRSHEASSVAILKPLLSTHNNNNNDNINDEELFPLSCQLVESSPPLDFYGRLRALQQETTTKNTSSCWNMQALRRIQVHRVTSIAQVLEFLLSIHTNDKCSCTGGILIQDLDVLIRGSNQNHHHCDLTTAQLMTMTQICKCSIVSFFIPHVCF
jgi:hypothetical protein